MKTTFKEYTNILIGMLCLLITTQLKASNIKGIPPVVNIFDHVHSKTNEKGLANEAVYFSLNKEKLAQIIEKKPATFELQIPINTKKKLKVTLKKSRIFSPDFKVIIQERDSYNTLSYSPNLYYRGAISGVKDALVAINFSLTEVTGVLSLNGENYNLGPYQNDIFVLYKERNLHASNPFSCSSEDPTQLSIHRKSQPKGRSKNKVRLYLECDYALYKNNNYDAQKTSDFATGLFNIIAAIYKIDDIDIELSELKIWKEQDPYPTSSAKAARNAFGEALDGQFNGDIAHLISNYTINGKTVNGGSANINALCDKKKAVGYTNISLEYYDYPTFSWTVYAVAHEIGHSLGSPHTHSCLWPSGPIDNCWCPEGDCDLGPEPAKQGGTLMSYCHLNPQWTDRCQLSADNPGISLASGFGPLPGALIRNNIAAANCLGVGPVIIPVFGVTAKVKEESCNKNDGHIQLCLKHGQAPYQYQWSNGATTKNIEQLSPGKYACTITDANGKIAKVEAELKGTSPFKVNAGKDQTISCINPIITLDANESAKGAAYRYEWSKINGVVSKDKNKLNLTVEEAGTYILSIQNIHNRCKFTDTVIVFEDRAEPNIQLKEAIITCTQPNTSLNFQSDKAIQTLTWTGPNDFFSTKKAPIINTRGRYTLEAVAENGCVTEVSTNVMEDLNPIAITTTDVVLTCQNESVELMAQASLENVNYKWTGPENFQSNIQTPVISTAGVYEVFVQNEAGCTGQAKIIVEEQKQAPIISVKGGLLNCNHPELTFQVRTQMPNLIYKWTGPNGFYSTQKTPTVSKAGIYTLEASIKNSTCSTTKEVLVAEDWTTPRIKIKGDHINCIRPKVQLKGLSNDWIETYQWEDASGEIIGNQQIQHIDKSGNYTLRVTGKNGCTASDRFKVEANTALPNYEIKTKNLSCANPESEINLSYEDQSLTFNWTGPNNFQTNHAQPNIKEPGRYILKVKNQYGCQKTDTLTIKRLTQSVVNIQTPQKLSCNQNSVFIDASNSILTETAKIEWTSQDGHILEGKHSSILEVNAPGTYTLTVRDIASECINIQTVQVEERSVISARLPEEYALNCQNEEPISLTPEVENFSEHTIFKWTKQNGQIHSTSNLKTLKTNTSGIYTLVVKDTVTGCVFSTSTKVLAAVKPKAIINKPEQLSCSKSAIILDGQSSSLTPNAIVQWYQDGILLATQNDLTLAASKAGEYTLLIIDTLDHCIASDKILLSAPEKPEVKIKNVHQDICNKNEGAISIDVQSNLPYKIHWSNGDTINSISHLAAGNYIATVTNNQGCQSIIQQEINSSKQVTLIESIVQPISCHGFKDGSIDIQLKEGHAPYQLYWSSGQEGLFANQLDSGMHYLEVLDAAGCITNFDFLMPSPNPLKAEIEIITDDVVLNVNGGTPDYQFEWSNGSAKNYALNLTPGEQEVTITDANGCRLNKSFEVEINQLDDNITINNTSIKIYPNPTSEYFQIKETFEDIQAYEIRIYNSYGKSLFFTKGNANQINQFIEVSSWEVGTYFLQIKVGGISTVQKVQVIKK